MGNLNFHTFFGNVIYETFWIIKIWFGLRVPISMINTVFLPRHVEDL